MKRITTLLIAAICFTSALGQDDLPEEVVEEEEIRRYTVEVIVFSYEEGVSVGTEIFLPDEPPPEPELLFDEEGNLVDADGNPIVEEDTLTDEEATATAQEVQPTLLGDDVVVGEEDDESEDGLVMLSEDEYILTNIVDEFDRLDIYTTIMHIGWTQPTLSQEETLPIELVEFGEVPEGLNGTFMLYLGRYLHLVVDIALDEPVQDVEIIEDQESFFDFRDARNRFDDVDPVEPMKTRYRIQENRIVRNGDLRYFDHPKFGVLAKITRVEKEEKNELDDELSDPLLSRIRQ